MIIVTRHNSGKSKTRVATDRRAHHGSAGGSFGSIRAGRSGPSFISVISLGLMTILSIGLQNVAGACQLCKLIESGCKKRVLGFAPTNPENNQSYLQTEPTRYIQVHFAKRKSAAVLSFPFDISIDFAAGHVFWSVRSVFLSLRSFCLRARHSQYRTNPLAIAGLARRPAISVQPLRKLHQPHFVLHSHVR